ncbi:MAG: helix-turn-helix domain-containing protein [Candidatus Gastranaerophilales bacterium]|nr:helix-turn-helix domain-containing protein [Candidatus Gastranaerophilales bacterium]
MCNNFRKELGKNIRKIRLDKKMTQETLCLESGISRSHIAMIETGKRDITISTLFKISRALKVDMSKIFCFDNIDLFKFDVEELYK